MAVKPYIRDLYNLQHLNNIAKQFKEARKRLQERKIKEIKEKELDKAISLYFS